MAPADMCFGHRGRDPRMRPSALQGSRHSALDNRRLTLVVGSFGGQVHVGSEVHVGSGVQGPRSEAERGLVR